MKTKLTKLPVTERALFARVNRALAKQGEFLRKSRPGSRTESFVGAFYCIDCRRNTVIAYNIDLEAFARELGVLADYETLS